MKLIAVIGSMTNMVIPNNVTEISNSVSENINNNEENKTYVFSDYLNEKVIPKMKGVKEQVQNLQTELVATSLITSIVGSTNWWNPFLGFGIPLDAVGISSGLVDKVKDFSSLQIAKLEVYAEGPDNSLITKRYQISKIVGNFIESIQKNDGLLAVKYSKIKPMITKLVVFQNMIHYNWNYGESMSLNETNIDKYLNKYFVGYRSGYEVT